jgi:DNA-binding transcriptional MerR regulator
MSIGEFARRSRLSAKALRIYDDLGLLPPARVDDWSGYRFYVSAQLETAQLIATLRRVGVPLATVKEWLTLDPAELAGQVSAFWRESEAHHASQRKLVTVLVDRLTGRNTVMYEVETRQMPQRSVLCLKRNVDEAGAWSLGKGFMRIMREARLPRLEGREGAVFAIYWGQVSADSDGPVEWCKPIPETDAETLAAQLPDLDIAACWPAPACKVLPAGHCVTCPEPHVPDVKGLSRAHEATSQRHTSRKTGGCQAGRPGEPQDRRKNGQI